MTSAKKKVVCLEEQSQHEPNTPDEANALYGVALLRIAVELKKGSMGFEEAVGVVVRRMSLSEVSFRAYLESNAGLLRALGRKSR